GGKTSFSAIVSARGGRVFGRARAAGRIRLAVADRALSMEPRRLPTRTRSAVCDWGLRARDLGLGKSTTESMAVSDAATRVESVVADARSVHAVRTAKNASPA